MAQSTLIVIDDDADLLSVVGRELALKSDFKVLPMPTGRAALDYIDANKVDFVLSDIRMPGIDGIEIVERLAGCAGRPEVLLMTGWADVTLAEALDRGAIGMVSKPLSISEVVSAFAPYRQNPAERWQGFEGSANLTKIHLDGGKSLEHSMTKGPIQFGRYGFFVPATATQLSEDEQFSFHISFDDHPSIEGRGRAVWSRNRFLHGFLAGSGILINSLSKSSIELFEKTVRKTSPRSVVPVGQSIVR